MMTENLQIISKDWAKLANVLAMPHSEIGYQQRLTLLNELLDEVGDDESHPLIDLVDTLETLIEAYEEEHYPIRKATPVEVLMCLMEEHDLKQSDLKLEIGSQGVVSEILNGKRQLNTRQIKALSERFHVSPNVFY
jgi:HTH-type transcriptional regulator/antitoxin HigA